MKKIGILYVTLLLSLTAHAAEESEDSSFEDLGRQSSSDEHSDVEQALYDALQADDNDQAGGNTNAGRSSSMEFNQEMMQPGQGIGPVNNRVSFLNEPYNPGMPQTPTVEQDNTVKVVGEDVTLSAMAKTIKRSMESLQKNDQVLTGIKDRAGFFEALKRIFGRLNGPTEEAQEVIQSINTVLVDARRQLSALALASEKEPLSADAMKVAQYMYDCIMFIRAKVADYHFESYSSTLAASRKNDIQTILSEFSRKSDAVAQEAQELMKAIKTNQRS